MDNSRASHLLYQITIPIRLDYHVTYSWILMSSVVSTPSQQIISRWCCSIGLSLFSKPNNTKQLYTSNPPANVLLRYQVFFDFVKFRSVFPDLAIHADTESCRCYLRFRLHILQLYQVIVGTKTPQGDQVSSTVETEFSTRLTTRSASSALRSAFLIVAFFCSTYNTDIRVTVAKRNGYQGLVSDPKILKGDPPPLRLAIMLRSILISPRVVLKSSSQSSNLSEDILSLTHGHETSFSGWETIPDNLRIRGLPSLGGPGAKDLPTTASTSSHQSVNRKLYTVF